MKNKKAFSLIEVMWVVLVLGVLVAVVMSVMRARINRAEEEEFKAGYFVSEQFRQIVGNNPYQIKESELTVNIFQVYLYDKASFLRFATEKDVESYLKLRIGLTEEEKEFERKVLEGLTEFKRKIP